MQRFDSEEILDSAQCPTSEREASLRDLCRMNRWFGGVATTRSMIGRVSASTGQKHFSLLDVAAGYGEVPRAAAAQLAKKGIILEITDVDRLHSNLRRGRGAVVADALALPCSSPDRSSAGWPVLLMRLCGWLALPCSLTTWSDIRFTWRWCTPDFL